MAEFTIYHVLFDDGQWLIRKEEEDEASYQVDTKEEAYEKARELATEGKTTVVLHRMDGTVEDVLNPRGKDFC